ncbi:unnamed protein product [Rotaria sp. Silwood1]|nr:unnamed protein product [Rotaria sp. Silwood1]CAF3692197.1 unnamed protein product [Rotaria sp. Silwood1]
MRDITDELVEHAHQLEVRFMKLDLRLKHPDHICVAQEFFEKLQSINILEQTVSDLENKFAHVFELINGADKIEYWHQESLDYHDALNCKLEQVKISGQNKDLRTQMTIA